VLRASTRRRDTFAAWGTGAAVFVSTVYLTPEVEVVAFPLDLMILKATSIMAACLAPMFVLRSVIVSLLVKRLLRSRLVKIMRFPRLKRRVYYATLLILCRFCGILFPTYSRPPGTSLGQKTVNTCLIVAFNLAALLW